MPDLLTDEALDKLRSLVEDAPDYLIPHMPQPDGGALLCDGDDNSLGLLYGTAHLMPLVRLIGGLPHTISALLSHVDAQQEAHAELMAHAEALCSELKEERNCPNDTREGCAAYADCRACTCAGFHARYPRKP